MTHDSSWKQIKQIFTEALELEGEDRKKYIDEACGNKTDLVEEVQSLLDAHELSGALDRPLDSIRMSAITIAKHERMKGKRIGNYKIIRELGHGGMGSVYLAERADGEFDQRAALKLMHSPFATDSQVKRFKNERQILASLEHDHIARILDGGITDEGQPYYVMEYVDGMPIHRYCDENRLTVAERFKLFLDVCSAVQYAHQKLVVHRDLKPSNILITGDGKVKLLDFGIAKVLDEKRVPEENISLTQTGILPLTPSYASPEQIKGESITTASDIYQLGLVMYELLSGYRPYRLDHKSPAEIERTICESEHQGPGKKLMGAGMPGISDTSEIDQICKNRDTPPRKLQKQLQGDPETIVMKAISKEPCRRYESAGELAEDIRRYLAGNPINAHADSKFYRAKKFIRRNPFESAAVTLIALLLAGYLVTVTWHQHRTRAALETAKLEAEKSAQVVEFMLGMFEAGDPLASPGDQVTARELLERGLKQAEELNDNPMLQANLFHVIGNVYMGLGRYQEAGRILQRAVDVQKTHFGPRDAGAARYLSSLAAAHTRTGDYKTAKSLYIEAHDIILAKYGYEHSETADIKASMGSWIPVMGIKKAVELRYEVLNIREKVNGSRHPLTADALVEVGTIERSRANPQKAIKLFRQALEIRINVLGRKHPETAKCMLHLADIYRLYKLDENLPEKLYREALDIQTAHYGRLHSSRLHAITGLASQLSVNGHFGESEKLLKENLELRKKIFGEVHPSYAEGLGHLASLYHKMGRFERSEDLYLRALALWEQLLGNNHVAVSGVLTGYGRLLTDMQKFREADSMLARALDIQQSHFGQDSGALILGAMGRLHMQQRELDAAEKHYRKAIGLFEQGGAGDHYDVIELRNEFNQLLALQEE